MIYMIDLYFFYSLVNRMIWRSINEKVMVISREASWNFFECNMHVNFKSPLSPHFCEPQKIAGPPQPLSENSWPSPSPWSKIHDTPYKTLPPPPVCFYWLFHNTKYYVRKLFNSQWILKIPSQSGPCSVQGVIFSCDPSLVKGPFTIGTMDIFYSYHL